jgi:hypothetical protein
MLIYTVADTSPQDGDHFARSGRFADRTSPMSSARGIAHTQRYQAVGGTV